MCVCVCSCTVSDGIALLDLTFENNSKIIKIIHFEVYFPHVSNTKLNYYSLIKKPTATNYF